jgi:3-oxoacyl-[acyl-carrier-protein] synthase-3
MAMDMVDGGDVLARSGSLDLRKDGIVRHSSIEGLGHYLPDGTVTNRDLESLVDTSDQWITDRTGIRSRHRAGSSQATSDLAIEAARAALADAGIGAEDLDLILLATATADAPVPASASLVQHALGARHVGAMDLNAGCSGFLYALHTADAFVRSGAAKRVLVIGSETLTRVTDYSDRRTCILFGDGAGACVVGTEGRLDVLYSSVGCDGSQADLIRIPAGGSRHPASAETVEGHQHYLQLDGSRVFKQAVRRMVESAREGLDAIGATESDISWVIPHQANARIVGAVGEQLEIAVPRLVNDIAETGNTSAASVPIALWRARSTGAFKEGELILLLAFGAGLTWGCQILRCVGED